MKAQKLGTANCAGAFQFGSFFFNAEAQRKMERLAKENLESRTAKGTFKSPLCVPLTSTQRLCV